jgi:hypothetical protein
MAYGEYVVRMDAVSVSTAITLVQVTAPATGTLEVVRYSIEQSNLTTNAMQRVQLLRKSAAATVTSFTPVPMAAGMPAAGASAGHTASSEGTDSTIIHGRSFSWLAGYEWVAMDEEERIIVPASGIIALKLPAAPGSATTITATLTFKEKS